MPSVELSLDLKVLLVYAISSLNRRQVHKAELLLGGSLTDDRGTTEDGSSKRYSNLWGKDASSNLLFFLERKGMHVHVCTWDRKGSRQNEEQLPAVSVH